MLLSFWLGDKIDIQLVESPLPTVYNKSTGTFGGSVLTCSNCRTVGWLNSAEANASKMAKIIKKGDSVQQHTDT